MGVKIDIMKNNQRKMMKYVIDMKFKNNNKSQNQLKSMQSYL